MDNHELEALATSLNELVYDHTFSVHWQKGCILMSVPGRSEKTEIDGEMAIDLCEVARDWCAAKIRLAKEMMLVSDAAGAVRSLEARFASKMSEAMYGATRFRIWQILKPSEDPDGGKREDDEGA